MKDSITLAVIGAASSQWILGLMTDLYLFEGLRGGEIRLVDPDRDGLVLTARLLARFNETTGREFQVTTHETFAGALGRCDCVLATFSPGSLDAFENDLEIPIRFGIRQPVSMTVGPSGISAALRTVPVASELVAAMERECPGAWLLSLVNPMSVVTDAMNRAARTVKVLGLCHETDALPRLLAPMCGVSLPADRPAREVLHGWMPAHGFEMTLAGLNHFAWLTRATVRGVDLLPAIRDFARTHREIPYAGPLPRGRWENDHAAKLALCQTFGFLPVAGDRHLVEFLPGLCNLRNGFGMAYGVSKTTVDGRRLLRERMRGRIARVADGHEEPEMIPSGEPFAPLLRALVTGGEVRTAANLPNRGQVENLPEGAVVETLAIVGPEGPRAVPSGALPGAIGSLCRLHADVQRLTVDAALAGSRDLLRQALALDPLSGGADLDETGTLADALLSANRAWLPRFFS